MQPVQFPGGAESCFVEMGEIGCGDPVSPQ